MIYLCVFHTVRQIVVSDILTGGENVYYKLIFHDDFIHEVIAYIMVGTSETHLSRQIEHHTAGRWTGSSRQPVVR